VADTAGDAASLLPIPALDIQGVAGLPPKAQLTQQSCSLQAIDVPRRIETALVGYARSAGNG
jgi:hypothetical protein